jgi:hypothetical protein
MSIRYKLVQNGVVYVVGQDAIRARQVVEEQGGRLLEVEEPDDEWTEPR